MNVFGEPAAELASVHAELLDLAGRIGGAERVPGVTPGAGNWLAVEKRLLGFDYVEMLNERGVDAEWRRSPDRAEFVRETISAIAYRIAVDRLAEHPTSADESPRGEAAWRRRRVELVAELLRPLNPAWADRELQDDRTEQERARMAAEDSRAQAQAYWRETPPQVRGKLALDADISPFTWFRVGGPADALFLPEDEEDLASFLAQVNEPVTVIGVGSNLLVRDGGVEGAVVRLGRGFNTVEARGDGLIYAGAAVPDAVLAKRAADAGIGGLEFYRGVPGTVGGACIMNAGCYGSETKDVLVEAYALTREGERIVLDNQMMDFAYRTSGGAQRRPGLIFTGALFRGTPDDPAAVTERMEAITARREQTQPIREKTGGSTFKNPPGHSAWKLVDGAGWRGKLFGGAKFSELHANFLINTGEATAADLEGLGETVRAEVKEKFGVQLDWEIKRIGRPRSDPAT